MITKSKILIIKLGHSALLSPEIAKEVSLGDVVRTTVILNYFNRCDNITWLVDAEAVPLLRNNERIHRLLEWNFETALQLQREYFDIVINLEKSPGICALSDSIHCYRRCGFRFSEWKGCAEAHYNTEKVLEIATDVQKKADNTMYWQQYLAKVIDKRWSIKDRYLMSLPIPKGDIYDVGLNFQVGPNWPEKAWPYANWRVLQKELESKGVKVSLQGNTNLSEYMDWIAQCATVVTCDSLGMHLAIAYNKHVVALFGPTPSNEVYLYNNGEKIVAPDFKMESISVQNVLSTALSFLRKNGPEHCPGPGARTLPFQSIEIPKGDV